MCRFQLIILSLLCAFLSRTMAQDTIERERSLLLKNIDLYKTGRYAKAEENFSLIVERLPNSPFITANHLMLVKTYYKKGQYKTALEFAKNFLDKYPTSTYRDDVLHTIGDCYFKLNRFETAVQSWLTAINQSSDPRLMRMLGELVTKTIRYRLHSADLNNIRQNTDSPYTQVLFALASAETKMDNGSVIAAQNQIELILNQYPDTPFRPRLEELLNTGSVPQKDTYRIGLLLPLSGQNADIGKELQEGAELAVSQFNHNTNLTVQLVNMDYGQEMTRALRMYKELAQNNSIIAAFGPIENDISAALSALSEYENLPLFSPTASDDGITDLSDYFFQLNSTIKTRMNILARYVMDSLSVKRFSTFAPVDNIFIKMSDDFVKTMKEAGSHLVSQEWYYPGDQDFNKQFMQIKRIGLKYAFRDSVWQEFPELDTLTVDSLYYEFQIAEKERLEETNTKIDSADIPVTSIGAIFIPIYKEDLQFVAPQIAYSNIRAQFIGNEDWYDLEQLKKNKNYINGLIFISDGFVDEENWDFKNFRNNFRERFKKSPSHYNIIGYDCFRFMLKGLTNGQVITREAFQQNVEKIGNFQGIYRSIFLNEDHQNKNVKILKYDYGQLVPLQ
jgi:ABC-type branched-subunit amino acid transport system substrate-binding protein